MPLARVGAILDLQGPALVAAIGRWWAAVEDDLRVRRELVHHLDRHLTGRQELMYDVRLRDVPEQKLLTAERRLTVDALDDFIDTASQALTAHLDASGVTEHGPMRVIYHGMVTEDSDGPVEVAMPFAGSVEPTGELRVRLQPAGAEAFTRLTRAQGAFPGILDAYDAVGRWIDQKPMRRAGSPAEVYLGDRHSSDTGPDAPYVDVTWPARPA